MENLIDDTLSSLGNLRCNIYNIFCFFLDLYVKTVSKMAVRIEFSKIIIISTKHKCFNLISVFRFMMQYKVCDFF